MSRAASGASPRRQAPVRPLEVTAALVAMAMGERYWAASRRPSRRGRTTSARLANVRLRTPRLAGSEPDGVDCRIGGPDSDPPAGKQPQYVSRSFGGLSRL